MKCDLYIPYNSYDDNKFDMNYFYSDSNSYIEALRKYAMHDSEEMQYELEKSETKYAKCKCTLYDENNTPMTIDKLLGYYGKNELIMMILEIDLSSAEEEFEGELNGWVNDHYRLDLKFDSSSEDRCLLEPKRDLKVVFKNLKGNDTYCVLSNTMLLEKGDAEHYFIIVDKVIFTKSF